jgi:hypothetical protein
VTNDYGDNLGFTSAVSFEGTVEFLPNIVGVQEIGADE